MPGMKLCECGCGEIVTPGKIFISGHNSRVNNPFKDKKHTKETKKKISVKNSGKNHPQYGMRGEDNPHWIPRETRLCVCGCGGTFECKENSKQRFIYGHSSQGENNGSYGKVYSEEERRKWSEMTKGEKNPFYGKKHIKESREKMTESRLGNGNHFYGKKHTEETKKKMSKARSEYMKNNEGNWKNTSIELRIQKLLSDLGIKFETHKSFNQIGINSNKYPYHQVDIYCFDYKLIIECDGEYWHSNEFPKTIKLDKEQTKDVIDSGFNIIRLKEEEIRNDLSACTSKILQEYWGD